MVTVLFFAQLREQLNTERVQYQGQTPCTMLDIIKQLSTDNPTWEPVLTADRLMMACNQDLVGRDHVVQTGDEIAFFPPVTGG